MVFVVDYFKSYDKKKASWTELNRVCREIYRCFFVAFFPNVLTVTLYTYPSKISEKNGKMYGKRGYNTVLLSNRRIKIVY